MFRQDLRTHDPEEMFKIAKKMLDQKLTKEAIPFLTSASKAGHKKSQFELAKIQEENQNFEEAARLYYLSEEKSPLHNLYKKNVFELATSTESIKLSPDEITFSEKSLVITCYTALLHKDNVEIRANLEKLINKFPQSFITLTLTHSLEMSEYPTLQTKNLLTPNLQDSIAVSVYLLSQPGLLPKVLVQIVEGYLNDSQALMARGINHDSLADQGKKMQSKLDLQHKITHFFLEMSEYHTLQTKNLLTQNLQERIAISVYLLSQPGLLPKVLVQIVAGYLNDSEALMARGINHDSLADQGKKVQSKLDRQHKITHFFDAIKTGFDKKNDGNHTTFKKKGS